MGFEDEGAGKGHALFLAAGELGGEAVAFGFELDHFEGFEGFALWVGDAAFFEAELDVLEGGEVGEEGVILEDGADVAAPGFEVIDDGAIEEDFAGGGLFEASDDAEGGGFAAAGGAKEGIEASAFEVEGEGVDGAVGGELFGDGAEFEDLVHRFTVF